MSVTLFDTQMFCMQRLYLACAYAADIGNLRGYLNGGSAASYRLDALTNFLVSIDTNTREATINDVYCCWYTSIQGSRACDLQSQSIVSTRRALAVNKVPKTQNTNHGSPESRIAGSPSGRKSIRCSVYHSDRHCCACIAISVLLGNMMQRETDYYAGTCQTVPHTLCLWRS